MASRTTEEQERLLYPESDGRPLADNTRQLRWLVILYGNLSALFREEEDVVVFADLLWYPVYGDPSACMAPDTMVVFGRPKGDRGSYMQWREEGVAPKVAFEVLSPNNTDAEMARKFTFYERHGVEEYYVLDPYAETMTGWRRRGRRLKPIAEMDGWVSPLLGIRFQVAVPEVVIYYPDGREFLSFEALAQQDENNRRQAVREKRQREKAEREADEAKSAREKAEREAEKAKHETERLRAGLRQLGVDPDEPVNNGKKKKPD